MTGNAHFTKQKFFQWVKEQLEKREIMYGQRFDKEKRKEELYKILFQEQKLTVSQIEQYFIPFGQAGYLSPRQKFELMLFVLEKDYGDSCLFLNERNACTVITAAEVEAEYLQWSLEERVYLSEEEKMEFFVQNLMDALGLGVLEVLKRAAPNGILLGELCPPLYENENVLKRIAVCVRGMVVRLPFLAVVSKEEMIKTIRYAIAFENRGELTMMEPILDFVKEDGTCVTAVRPPAGKNWGIRILYNTSGKEGHGWKM